MRLKKIAKFWAWSWWERRLSKTVQAFPVADPGKGPRGARLPPLIFRPNWGLISGSGWPHPPLPPSLSEGLDPPLLSVQELNKLPACFDLGIGITFLLYFRSVTHFRRLPFSILPSYSNPTYNIWLNRKISFEYWLPSMQWVNKSERKETSSRSVYSSRSPSSSFGNQTFIFRSMAPCATTSRKRPPAISHNHPKHQIFPHVRKWKRSETTTSCI